MPQSMGVKSGNPNSALLDWRNKLLISLMLRASTAMSVCADLRQTQGVKSARASSSLKKPVTRSVSRREMLCSVANLKERNHERFTHEQPPAFILCDIWR